MSISSANLQILSLEYPKIDPNSTKIYGWSKKFSLNFFLAQMLPNGLNKFDKLNKIDKDDMFEKFDKDDMFDKFEKFIKN